MMPGDGYGFGRALATGGYGFGWLGVAVRLVLRLATPIIRRITLVCKR